MNPNVSKYTPQFNRCNQFVLRDDIEGGRSNRAADHGGDTKYGISSKYHPDVDLDRLDRPGAIAIYWTDYWTTIHGDQLPPAVALATFDWAVNSGCPAAVKGLQRALQPYYKGEIDGKVGPQTIEALLHADPYGIVEEMCEERMTARRDQVKRDPGQAANLHGWCVRIMKVALAAGIQLP